MAGLDRNMIEFAKEEFKFLEQIETIVVSNAKDQDEPKKKISGKEEEHMEQMNEKLHIKGIVKLIII